MRHCPTDTETFLTDIDRSLSWSRRVFQQLERRNVGEPQDPDWTRIQNQVRQDQNPSCPGAGQVTNGAFVSHWDRSSTEDWGTVPSAWCHSAARTSHHALLCCSPALTSSISSVWRPSSRSQQTEDPRAPSADLSTTRDSSDTGTTAPPPPPPPESFSSVVPVALISIFPFNENQFYDICIKWSLEFWSLPVNVLIKLCSAPLGREPNQVNQDVDFSFLPVGPHMFLVY